MPRPLAELLNDIKDQKLTEGLLSKPKIDAFKVILGDFNENIVPTGPEQKAHEILVALKKQLQEPKLKPQEEEFIINRQRNLLKAQLQSQPPAIDPNAAVHSATAALAGFKNTSQSLSTPVAQISQIFDSELERVAENAMVRGVNYEYALGKAQIEYSVGQMANKGEYSDEEIQALQEKENAKALKEGRNPKKLTKEYLGDKIDRSPEMLQKMAVEKETQLQALADKIGYKFGASSADKVGYKNDNPILERRVAAFKTRIAAKAQQALDELSQGAKWATLPLPDKRRMIMEKLQEVAEKELDELYPNHNTPKYIAAHQKKNEKNESVPLEDTTQRLPGAVAFALNPQDLLSIIVNRREGGFEEEEAMPAVPPPQPSGLHPELEVDTNDTAKKKPMLSIDNKGMRFFFTEEFSKALEKEDKVTISIATNISPDKFRDVCLGMQTNIQKYNDANTNKAVFQNIECKAHPSASNSFQIMRDNESLVEMVHTPAGKDKAGKHQTGKIDFVLTDPKQQDESLLLMVVSAKNALEKLGKSKFNIENCEDNPETAAKLYLTGLSLGLQPQFKDANGETMKAIKDCPMKITIDDRELSLEQVLTEAQTLKGDELKKYMKALEVAEEPVAKATTKLK